MSASSSTAEGECTLYKCVFRSGCFSRKNKNSVRVGDQLKIPLSRFIVAAEFLVMIDVIAHLADAVDDEFSHVRDLQRLIGFPGEVFLHLFARPALDKRLGGTDFFTSS
jgi:hypothetical protein